jgi:hypothetical protein
MFDICEVSVQKAKSPRPVRGVSFKEIRCASLYAMVVRVTHGTSPLFPTPLLRSITSRSSILLPPKKKETPIFPMQKVWEPLVTSFVGGDRKVLSVLFTSSKSSLPPPNATFLALVKRFTGGSGSLSASTSQKTKKLAKLYHPGGWSRKLPGQSFFVDFCRFVGNNRVIGDNGV